MLKLWSDGVVCFDCEWVPDVPTIRRLYGLAETVGADEVIARAYAEAGADEANPRPYLKTALCRIVCISCVAVDLIQGVATIRELWDQSEGDLIERFLTRVARNGKQLIGYNSKNADLPALLQRGIANGIVVPGFCKRAAKPWEGVDYFDRYGHQHVDLLDVIAGFGKGTPKLDEICAACEIPTKAQAGEIDGGDVADLWWVDQERDRVIRYCTQDALRVWGIYARMRHMAGLLHLDRLPVWHPQVATWPGLSEWRDAFAPRLPEEAA